MKNKLQNLDFIRKSNKIISKEQQKVLDEQYEKQTSILLYGSLVFSLFFLFAIVCLGG